MMRKNIFACIAGLLMLSATPSVQGSVVINEAVGSTTGADAEFIELFNSGSTAVDISGWAINEIESDAVGSFGTVDDTFTIPAMTTLNAGGFFLIGNETFETGYGITPDLNLPLSIENSSYTLQLVNALDVQQYAVSVFDGDGDVSPIAVDLSVGPDGTFLPAGFFLTTDAGTTAGFQDFTNIPSTVATPGASNVAVIPEPSSFALIAMTAGGLGFIRRRRK
jgi:hypothetical protein